MLVFPYKLPNSFYKSFIPNRMYTYILLRTDKEKLTTMSSALKQLGVNMPTVKVIKYALENMDIIENGNTTKMIFSNSKTIGKYTLSQIIRLIDSGTIETKGIGTIRKAEEYINSRTGDLREEYLDTYVS